jgi:CRISPR/Cas system Type II protein with McrA/HNH and RuvC-like nuclease domain
MEEKTMTVDEFWEHEFGYNTFGQDFAGRQIMKSAYKNGSQYEWDVDHILPLSFKKPGKIDNINNLQITHVQTNREKSNKNPFIINGVKYQIKKIKNLYREDEVAPYPYEENGKKYCIIFMED